MRDTINYGGYTIIIPRDDDTPPVIHRCRRLRPSDDKVEVVPLGSKEGQRVLKLALLDACRFQTLKHILK